MFKKTATPIIVTEDVVSTKKTELAFLQAESESALTSITSTINKLEETNVEIQQKISEIEEVETQLAQTKAELVMVYNSNVKVSDKFKALLEV